MGPAWAKAHLTGDLSLPLLWLLLSQVHGSQALPGWHFTYSEVVIPRKVSHRVSGVGVQDQLSYRIHFRDRRHVVHMKVKKNLLPRHFPVITSNDQGALQEDYPFVPRDCYYYSYLEGVPGSMGTLDTCYGGLRGMLQVDDLTYEIKPLEASSKFEHVLSLLVKERSTEAERCQNEGEDADLEYEEPVPSESPRAAPVYYWLPHSKHGDLHYTVSNSLYKTRPNMTYLIETVVTINDILHTIYFQQGVSMHIRVMRIWNKIDMRDVTTQKTAYAAVELFGNYIYHYLYRDVSYDTGILLTGHKIAGRIYFAFQGGLCSPNWGAMFVYVANLHIFLASCVLAHTMGHSFEMAHDVPGCRCFRRSSCIMAPVPGLHDMFSNCSYNIMRYRQQRFDHCLSVKLKPHDNFPYVAPRCGDNITNQREECDCGTFKNCAEDECCETNCLFTVDSECNRGACCIRCKHANPGWICREKSGICDLSEYCKGNEAVCPDDFYIQDGTLCSPLSVCVQGNCSDRDLQCQSLFGYQVRDAVPACYDKLNVIGDRFGNCGSKPERYGEYYIKCEPDDVLCGMLHCRNVKEVPGGGEHTTFRELIVTDVHQEKCFGFDIHFGTDTPSFGLVMDGATCGPGQYCFNKNCTFHQDMHFDCDISKCNFRGVCNNKKHCHCQQGWKPPGCNETGPGGSVDSGPPPYREAAVRGRVTFNVNQALILLMIRAAFFLLVFIIGCISFLSEHDDQE